jgi:hypothetical protein
VEIISSEMANAIKTAMNQAADLRRSEEFYENTKIM